MTTLSSLPEQPARVEFTPTTLTGLKTQKPVLWVGCLSYEDRCIASLRELIRMRMPLSSAILVRYALEQLRNPDAEKRRTQNMRRIAELAKRAYGSSPDVVEIEPYSFTGIRTLLQDLDRDFADSVLAVDLSCITKIHSLAIASLHATRLSRQPWLLAYSSPENYGDFKAHTNGGWRDVLVAPLADPSGAYNEADGRGIVVPGHEADRLQLALSEVEPTGGSIIMVDTPGRPDWRRRCEQRNAGVLNRLRRMQVSRWTPRDTKIARLPEISGVVATETDRARQSDAPITIFPFGPKWLLFCLSWHLCRRYPEGAWFVYPVPGRYDTTYSEGVSETVWFSLRSRDSASEGSEQNLPQP